MGPFFTVFNGTAMFVGCVWMTWYLTLQSFDGQAFAREMTRPLKKTSK